MEKTKAIFPVLWPIIVIIVFIVACANFNKPKQEASAVESLLRDLEAAFASHDYGKILPLYTEDCIVETAGGIRIQGKTALEDSLKESFASFPDLKMTAKAHLISGNRVASELAMIGTNTGSTRKLPATGRYIALPIASFLEIEAGKIKRQTIYFNMVTMLKQLGIRRLP